MLDGGADVDAAQRWGDGWQSSIEERAVRARVLAGRIAGLTAAASSGDGLVEVTVTSSGAIDRLHLDERIRGQSAARTAEHVLAAVRGAQAELVKLATEAAAGTVGADSATGRAMVQGFAARFPDAAGGVADAR